MVASLFYISNRGVGCRKPLVLTIKIAKPASSHKPPTILAAGAKLRKIHKLTVKPINGEKRYLIVDTNLFSPRM